MKANICANCLALVKGTLDHMKSVTEWGDCEVCGNIAVFYGKKYEIDQAREHFNKTLDTKDNNE